MRIRSFLNIIAGVCTILLLTACPGGSDSDPEITLTVTPQNTVLDENDQAQLTVRSNTVWTVTCNDRDKWLQGYPSGSTSGERTITVYADSRNTGTTERIQKLLFRTETGAKELLVTITQKPSSVTPPPEATLTVSKDQLSFQATGGEDKFTIQSNTSWTVTSNQAWCTVSPSSGSNDATVTVKVGENTSTSRRNATITVKDTNGSLTRNISVIQAEKDEAPVIGRDEYEDDSNLDNQ